MPEQNLPGQQPLPIKATDEALKAHYANVMNVSHTPEEFILDFLFVAPPAGQLIQRIATSPGHLKRIIAALTVNLEKYEQTFGKVEKADDPSDKRGGIGFRVD
jgi:hypothetical protein